MEHHAVFSATLGLAAPWYITGVSYSPESNRLDISVDFYPGNIFPCPECGAGVEASAESRELWFHDSFCNYSTYLHAHVPLLRCACGRVAPAPRPWAREGSRFSLMNASQAP